MNKKQKKAKKKTAITDSRYNVQPNASYNIQSNDSVDSNEDLYVKSSFASTLVDKKVDDSTRNGITFTSSNSVKLNKDFKKTNILHLINRALKEARVFGGAGIVIVDKKNDLAKPFDINKITPDSEITYQVFNSTQLQAYSTDTQYDILSEDLLNIEYYSLQIATSQANRGGIQKIHKSRILKFHGKPLMSFDKLHTGLSYSNAYGNNTLGWGRSIFNSKLFKQIKAFDSLYDKIIKMIGKGAVDFFALKDVDAKDITDKEAVQKIVDSIKQNQEESNISLLVGDSDYKRIQSSFSGYQEALDNLVQYLSINEGYPLTYFLGSPTPGSFLNGGSADMQAYYAVVSDMQSNQIHKPLCDLIYIWQMQTYGTMYEDLDFDFNPLFEPNPKEKQELESSRINNLMNLYNSGVIGAETVVKSLQADTTIPIEAKDISNAKEIDNLNEDQDDNREEEQ